MTTFFEIGVCPWPDLSSLFQYTSPTPVVSLHLIPRIQYHPGNPVALLTGSSLKLNSDDIVTIQPNGKAVDASVNFRDRFIL